MSENTSQLFNVFTQYRRYIIPIIIAAFICVITSLAICYHYQPLSSFQKALAGFLMKMGETVLIVGIIGGSIKFIIDEAKDKQQKQEQLAKEEQENRNKEAVSPPSPSKIA